MDYTRILHLAEEREAPRQGFLDWSGGSAQLTPADQGSNADDYRAGRNGIRSGNSFSICALPCHGILYLSPAGFAWIAFRRRQTGRWGRRLGELEA